MNATPAPRCRGRLVRLLVGAGAGAMLLAGCGSVGHSAGTGDRAKGKVLFTQKCGSCHTLADAGTQGQIGPNLDYAFLASRRDGLGQSTFVQVVRGQIAYPISSTSTGSPGMPANLVEGQDAEDVASYVAAVAGVGTAGSSTPQAPSPAPPATTTGSEAAAGNAAAGKTVFASAGCVGCHTLADAGATGTVGPNLDTKKPSAALVVERVTNGKGPMPAFKGQLSATQIADVAAYVSSVAGK